MMRSGGQGQVDVVPWRRFTCLRSWQCLGFSAPSSRGFHWWLALSWAASAGWSAWWPPERQDTHCNDENVEKLRKTNPFLSLFCVTSCPVATSMAVNTVPEALRTETMINLHSMNTNMQNYRTYPCPIFSYRVYFFFGSPILTMVPVGEQTEDTWFESR